ncbi:MAG: DNA polymerase IV [Legionellales bacterium]|nr:DNA polymerase IV [Legionellales bacterium]
MRKIIHIDMDCFYAAIEIRDDPSLEKLPVAVGGSELNRGVICTCNYLAREYGVHSAMSTAHAQRLCPDLVVVPVNITKYRKISMGIRDILTKYTRNIEPISLDEAYLDVTDSKLCHNSATRIASSIRDEISSKFNLTASAGVAPNKFLAKVASDWHKPDGQFVIEPNQVSDFIENLKVEKLPGVGNATAKKLYRLGIYTCGDVGVFPEKKLIDKFGKFGYRLIELSVGKDPRRVRTNINRKSFSVEKTFANDIQSLTYAHDQLMQLFNELELRLQKHKDRKISKQFVKIKFSNFFSTTVERRTEKLSKNIFTELFYEGYKRQEFPIRLLGLGLKFVDSRDRFHQYQLDFIKLG